MIERQAEKSNKSNDKDEKIEKSEKSSIDELVKSVENSKANLSSEIPVECLEDITYYCVHCNNNENDSYSNVKDVYEHWISNHSKSSKGFLFSINHKNYDPDSEQFHLTDGMVMALRAICLNRNYKCGHCDENFMTKNELEEHHSVKHSQIESMFDDLPVNQDPCWICSICNTRLEPTQWREHIEKHIWTCTVCNFSSHTKGMVSHDHQNFNFHNVFTNAYRQMRIVHENGLVLCKYHLLGTHEDDTYEIEFFFGNETSDEVHDQTSIINSNEENVEPIEENVPVEVQTIDMPITADSIATMDDANDTIKDVIDEVSDDGITTAQVEDKMLDIECTIESECKMNDEKIADENPSKEGNGLVDNSITIVGSSTVNNKRRNSHSEDVSVNPITIETNILSGQSTVNDLEVLDVMNTFNVPSMKDSKKQTKNKNLERIISSSRCGDKRSVDHSNIAVEKSTEKRETKLIFPSTSQFAMNNEEIVESTNTFANPSTSDHEKHSETISRSRVSREQVYELNKQRNRMNNLCISNIPQIYGENLLEIFLQLCQAININLSVIDVDSINRLHRANGSIIVTLAQRHIRDIILNSPKWKYVYPWHFMNILIDRNMPPIRLNSDKTPLFMEMELIAKRAKVQQKIISHRITDNGFAIRRTENEEEKFFLTTADLKTFIEKESGPPPTKCAKRTQRAFSVGSVYSTPVLAKYRRY